MKEVREWGSPVSGPCYVGIDPSLTGFGVTLLNEEGYRTVVYSSSRRGVHRLDDINRFLFSLLDSSRVVDVAMEGTVVRSASASVLGELSGVVKLTLHHLGMHPVIVPPTSLKKYVTGKGTGVPKSVILMHTFKKWGVEFSDDNAADSYGLAHLVSGRRKLEYEKQVYDKLVASDGYRT